MTRLMMLTMAVWLSVGSLFAQKDENRDPGTFYLFFADTLTAINEGSEWTMRFSNRDSLGVEYPEPVSVYFSGGDAGDSLSFAIQDIDSLVMFEPEIELQPGVFELTAEYLPYILDNSTFRIAFSKNINGRLPLPSANQFVVCCEYQYPLQNGFYGKVKEIVNKQDSIIVQCFEEAQDVTAIFKNILHTTYYLSDEDAKALQDNPADSRAKASRRLVTADSKEKFEDRLTVADFIKPTFGSKPALSIVDGIQILKGDYEYKKGDNSGKFKDTDFKILFSLLQSLYVKNETNKEEDLAQMVTAIISDGIYFNLSFETDVTGSFSQSIPLPTGISKDVGPFNLTFGVTASADIQLGTDVPWRFQIITKFGLPELHKVVFVGIHANKMMLLNGSSIALKVLAGISASYEPIVQDNSKDNDNILKKQQFKGNIGFQLKVGGPNIEISNYHYPIDYFKNYTRHKDIGFSLDFISNFGVNASDETSRLIGRTYYPYFVNDEFDYEESTSSEEYVNYDYTLYYKDQGVLDADILIGKYRRDLDETDIFKRWTFDKVKTIDGFFTNPTLKEFPLTGSFQLRKGELYEVYPIYKTEYGFDGKFMYSTPIDPADEYPIRAPYELSIDTPTDQFGVVRISGTIDQCLVKDMALDPHRYELYFSYFLNEYGHEEIKISDYELVGNKVYATIKENLVPGKDYYVYLALVVDGDGTTRMKTNEAVFTASDKLVPVCLPTQDIKYLSATPVIELSPEMRNTWSTCKNFYVGITVKDEYSQTQKSICQPLANYTSETKNVYFPLNKSLAPKRKYSVTPWYSEVYIGDDNELIEKAEWVHKHNSSKDVFETKQPVIETVPNSVRVNEVQMEARLYKMLYDYYKKIETSGQKLRVYFEYRDRSAHSSVWKQTDGAEFTDFLIADDNDDYEQWAIFKEAVVLSINCEYEYHAVLEFGNTVLAKGEDIQISTIIPIEVTASTDKTTDKTTFTIKLPQDALDYLVAKCQEDNLRVRYSFDYRPTNRETWTETPDQVLNINNREPALKYTLPKRLEYGQSYRIRGYYRIETAEDPEQTAIPSDPINYTTPNPFKLNFTMEPKYEDGFIKWESKIVDGTDWRYHISDAGNPYGEEYEAGGEYSVRWKTEYWLTSPNDNTIPSDTWSEDATWDYQDGVSDWVKGAYPLFDYAMRYYVEYTDPDTHESYTIYKDNKVYHVHTASGENFMIQKPTTVIDEEEATISVELSVLAKLLYNDYQQNGIQNDRQSGNIKFYYTEDEEVFKDSLPSTSPEAWHELEIPKPSDNAYATLIYDQSKPNPILSVKVKETPDGPIKQRVHYYWKAVYTVFNPYDVVDETPGDMPYITEENADPIYIDPYAISKFEVKADEDDGTHVFASAEMGAYGASDLLIHIERNPQYGFELYKEDPRDHDTPIVAKQYALFTDKLIDSAAGKAKMKLTVENLDIMTHYYVRCVVFLNDGTKFYSNDVVEVTTSDIDPNLIIDASKRRGATTARRR